MVGASATAGGIGGVVSGGARGVDVEGCVGGMVVGGTADCSVFGYHAAEVEAAAAAGGEVVRVYNGTRVAVRVAEARGGQQPTRVRGSD